MKTIKFHRAQTNLFDNHQVNLVYNQEMFLPFIGRTFSKENIEKQIDSKSSFHADSRSLLVEVLKEQYEKIEPIEAVSKNIELLKSETTYTITTGHQLSLLTGPLYFVVKILHVIKQCEELNKGQGEINFVPVYWMATEDHDFEEIQSCHLFNQKITWESDQIGPVGRFNLDGLEEVKSQFKELFKNGDEELHLLVDALNGENYAGAMRSFVHQMFGKYGLVIIDGDNRALKQSFSSIMKKELRDQFSFEAVSISTSELEKNGGRAQVNPREINLFYIEDGIRSRIVKENHVYQIEGVGDYDLNEILALIDSRPECFSPNVILRPLYQEVILPNISYVGGGGEISYWLQLKRVFQTAGVVYPLIQVRNSVLWIDSSVTKKIAKIDLLLEDVFKQEDLLKKEFVEANEYEILDFDAIDSKRNELLKALDSLIVDVDPNLHQYSQAEATRITKQLDGIQAKLIKVSKSKHEGAMKAIEQIKEKLFPDNGLQERKLNFFHFCMKGNVNERLDLLYSALDPFEKDLIVIREA